MRSFNDSGYLATFRVINAKKKLKIPGESVLENNKLDLSGYTVTDACNNIERH